MKQVLEESAQSDAKAISFLNDIRRRAIDALRTPVDDDDREEALFLRQKADTAKAEGNRLFQLGEYIAAIRHYTTAIALFPPSIHTTATELNVI